MPDKNNNQLFSSKTTSTLGSSTTERHAEFVRGARTGEYGVSFRVAPGQLVRSHVAMRENKPAHYFWHYVSFSFFVLAPILFFTVGLIYGLGALMAGVIVYKAAKKSDASFVRDNMESDPEFYLFALKNGVSVINRDHNIVDG